MQLDCVTYTSIQVYIYIPNLLDIVVMINGVIYNTFQSLYLCNSSTLVKFKNIYIVIFLLYIVCDIKTRNCFIIFFYLKTVILTEKQPYI